MAFELIDLILLTVDITLVFRLNLYLFSNCVIVNTAAFDARQRCNICIAKLRASTSHLNSTLEEAADRFFQRF